MTYRPLFKHLEMFKERLADILYADLPKARAAVDSVAPI